MNRIKFILMLIAFFLGCCTLLQAQTTSSVSQSSIVRLQRDPTYEQDLKYIASPDTAITPAKVFRWMNSLMGNTSLGTPSNLEFQPIVRAHDSRKEVIGQIAYKF